MIKTLLLSFCMVLATTWLINAATVEELRTPDLKGLNVTNQEMAA